MAKAVSLFSGSKGNSYYIGTSSEGVLIDAGRNCKQILLALEANELDIKKIGGIFITHEHTDHCSALKVLTKKYDIKIYGSAGTLEAMVKADRINPDAKVEVIDKEIEIGNMLVKRINTSHDAAESCCYRVITADGKSALIATDMGVMLPKVRESAQKRSLSDHRNNIHTDNPYWCASTDEAARPDAPECLAPAGREDKGDSRFVYKS